MQGVVLSYGLLGALAIALCVAAVTDIQRRQIDNWLNLAIALLAPVYWYAAGLGWVDVVFQLGLALVVLLVLVGLFLAGWMGGGDVKLLTALALWIHPLIFLTLLVLMSMMGGLLTLGLYGWHRFHKRTGKIAVPYGVAISAAGLWVLATQYFAVIPFGPQVG